MTEIIQDNPAPAPEPTLSHAARIVDGKVTDLRPQIPDSKPTADEGVIGTAHVHNGRPLARSQITPDSIVTVPMPGLESGQMEMTAADAERFGFLKWTPAGYENATPDATETAHTPDPETVERDEAEREKRSGVYQPEVFDPETEKAYQETIRGIPTSFTDRIAEAWIGGEEIGDQLAKDIAATMPGVEPETVRERVTRAVNMYGDQAYKAVADRYGVDAERWFQHVRQVMPKQLDKAMHLQATQRTTKGYDELMREYVANLDKINPKAALAIKSPGITVERRGNDIIVTTQSGQEMLWEQAVRFGFVKLKGHK
jgi:hypothetical protein